MFEKACFRIIGAFAILVLGVDAVFAARTKALKESHDAQIKAWQQRATNAESALAPLSQRCMDFQAKLIQAESLGPMKSSSSFDQQTIDQLIRLCHPDRHQGKNAEAAHEITKKLLSMRMK